jgi:Ca2+-binding EF-hand superfamily protein
VEVKAMGGGASKQSLKKSQIQKFVKDTGFSESEIKFLYLRFQSLCSNGSCLSKKDIERDVNLKANPYILRVFNSMSKNGTGEVVFETFIKTASIFREGHELENKLEFIFGLFDHNMDNVLDADELKTMINSFHPGISREMCEEMVKKTVKDVACFSRKSETDGKIRKDDFVAYAEQLPGIDKLLVLNLASDVT